MMYLGFEEVAEANFPQEFLAHPNHKGRRELDTDQVARLVFYSLLDG